MRRTSGDAPAGGGPTPAAVPAELERRLAALESGGECGDDFDLRSLCWLSVLGVLLPIGLLLLGWWA
jgi:hypothetical protein